MAQVTVTINGVDVTGSTLLFTTSDPPDPTGLFWVRTDLIGQGATLPGAPTAVSATAGNGQATVSFVAPASNGGAAIIDYTVVSTPGNISATGSSSPITVTGLANGTSYTFTVKARNSVGQGPASSPSGSVTPTASATTLFTDTFDNLTSGGWTVTNSGTGTMTADGTLHRAGSDIATGGNISRAVTSIDTSTQHRKISFNFQVANKTVHAYGNTSTFYAGFGTSLTNLTSWIAIGYSTAAAVPGIVAFTGWTSGFTNLVALADVQLATDYLAEIEVLGGNIYFRVYLGGTLIKEHSVGRITTIGSIFATLYGTDTTSAILDNMILEGY